MPREPGLAAAIYARVSAADQNTAAQLEALRQYATARGWDAVEFVDHGVSGAKESRPALDALLSAARRREVGVVVVTKLDRFARSLHQLVALAREFEALGVDLVVLDQAIDTTTPAGRLLFHVLGAIAEFERDLIRERVVAGLRRAGREVVDESADLHAWSTLTRSAGVVGLASRGAALPERSSRPSGRCAGTPKRDRTLRPDPEVPPERAYTHCGSLLSTQGRVRDHPPSRSRRTPRRMEDAMKPFARLVPIVAGLVLLLIATSSRGQVPNPTASDDKGNTAGGSIALFKLVDSGFCGVEAGCQNTAFGAAALNQATIGINNTAIGFNALGDNTGNDNTAVGFQALQFNTGSKNTAVGRGALNAFVGNTGSRNIAIGFKAGVASTSGNNNIYIGNAGNGAESRTMRLGGIQTSTFIAGINGVAVGDTPVMIDSATGQLGTGASSVRYKRDIEPMASRSEGVFKLRPVTFVYKEDTRGVTHYGLIAEEVAIVYPELVTRTATGEVQSVKYHELIPMLLNELQRQRQELAELRALLRQGREQRQHQAPRTTLEGVAKP